MRSILIFVCLLTIHSFLTAQTIPNPTQTDAIIIDNGTSGKADPNDRIRYTVTIQNTGGPSATGTQFIAVPDPRTTFVAGSFRSSPLAVPDAYTATGNVGISIPAASGVKANDFDDNLGMATLSCGTCLSANNGTVVMNNDGSFTYNPPAGFTGSDNFSYTMTDGNPVGLPVPLTDATTVTITVANLIWFIDNSAAAGDGRRSSPFNSLAAFNAGSAVAGDVVYVEHTGMNYTGGIVLQNTERLYGEGHTGGANLSNVLPFSLAPNSITLPAINGIRPILTNAAGDGVTLATDNTLRGFDVGACSDFGMDNTGTSSVGNLIVSEVSINNTSGGGFDASNGSGASMNAVFGSISSTNGVNGIDLTSCAGTFTVNGGTITNPTGTGVLILNGSVVFSSSGAITDNSGFAVDIDNHDSNNVTFSGNITSSATGIRVQNCGGGTKTFSGASKSLATTTNKGVTLASNSGAIIDFTGGGLVITTTSGVGFDATGGGTISVTGATNTITSTTGTSLNVDNTNIGAGNLNFLSINCNGASNAVTLNVTGVAAGNGGLNVTGTGTTNGSGGTLQNIANRGVSVVNSKNLTLKNMTFTNVNNGADGAPCISTDNSGCNAAIHLNTVTTAVLDNVDIDNTNQQGINLREVNGFSLLNSTVINGGDEGEEADLYAINLFGTCAINNSSLTVGAERCALIYNTTKTLALTVNGSTFGMNQSLPFGADGLEINSYTSSNTTIDVINSTFVQPKTNGMQVITETNSFTSVDVTGSTFSPGPAPGLSAAIDFVTATGGDMDFNIINNPLIQSRGINAVNIFSNATSTFEGRINSNTVLVGPIPVAGAGIRVTNQGNGNSRVEIKNNNVTGADDYGITTVSQLGTGRLDAIITGNTVSLTTNGAYGIHSAAGNSGSTFTNKVCSYVANNITTAVPVTAIGNFQARAATPTHEIMLQGTGASVAAVWNFNTNSPLSPPAVALPSGTGVITFGATCNGPTNAMP